MKSFDDLWIEIQSKAMSRPVGSGTVVEIDAGVHAIGKKIVEEAAEVWMAAEFQEESGTLSLHKMDRNSQQAVLPAYR